MLNYTSNAAIEEQEDQALQEALEAERGRQGAVIELVAYVHKCWQAAKTAKLPIERGMLENLRRKLGEYDPDKLAAIREQGGSEIFMMLTEEKCGAAESWIDEILFPANEDPFGVEPTPRPDLSPDRIQEMQMQLQQEAERYAMAHAGVLPPMELYVQRAQELIKEFESRIIKEAKEHATKAEIDLHDAAVEANWREALKDAVPDLVMYPAGFVKGPIVRMGREFVWGQDGRPSVEIKKQIEFESPSPWDIYPSPTSKNVGDGYIIERMEFTRSDLYSLIGVDGYDDEAIRTALEEAGTGYIKNWLNLANDNQRARLEGRRHEDWDPEGKIDALQFWGHVQGLALLEYGMSPAEIQDPWAEYFCEIVLIGQHVIKAEINGDPLGRPPYFKAGFRRKKGSFWQTSMVDLMKDCQDMCNSSARNLANNMGIASGPQVGVDISKIPPGESLTKIKPWKIWQFEMGNMPQTRDPMWFFQPNPLVSELMAVYDKFSLEADNKTGVPKYSYGGDTQGVAGALKTASGMSMMMGAAARSIKNVVMNIDHGLIEPSIQRLAEWMMLYFQTENLLSGDIKIQARGASAMIAKEQQQVRRNEFFSVALHPTVTQIIGLPGLAEILRKILQGLDIDADDVVPPKEEIMRMMQMQQMQQAQQQQEGQGAETDHAGNVAGGRDANLTG